MQHSTRTYNPVPDSSRPRRGLLDTSVVIDLKQIDPITLPHELAISTITMAELAAGPHATKDVMERAKRQELLQRAELTFDPLPFDAAAARSYGLIYASVIAVGRKARGPRAVDLMIAAIASSLNIPLYTRNPKDFVGLSNICEIVEVK